MKKKNIHVKSYMRSRHGRAKFGGVVRSHSKLLRSGRHQGTGSTYIVSRHPGAINWLRSKGIGGEVIPHLTPELISKMGSGDRVYGVLPIQLIHQLLERGVRVFTLVLPRIPPEQRGKEMSPGEMDSAGANVFEVRTLGLGETLY